MFNLVLGSSYQPHDATVFPVYNPLPGSWFAAAYLPDWDQHVQQEVLSPSNFHFFNGGSSNKSIFLCFKFLHIRVSDINVNTASGLWLCGHK